jgi:hypothetical protein
MISCTVFLLCSTSTVVPIYSTVLYPDVMIFARLIFINLHVLVCEGILGVLDDVSAGVRVSAVLALSQVFVSFFMFKHSVDTRKRTRVYACMQMIALFFPPF